MSAKDHITLNPDRIDPATTKILVIDVQNDFCAEGGWFHRNDNDLSMIQEAVGKLEGFLDVARSVGVEPIFVRAIYDKIYLSPPMLERHERVGLGVDHCLTGTWGAEFYRIGPTEDELVITKHRYSAFRDTELNALLRAQRIENLIFTGVTSNVCVESSARDAYMLDYHVVFLSDASATYDAAAHQATLANIERAFGIVASVEEVKKGWEAGQLIEQADAVRLGSS